MKFKELIAYEYFLKIIIPNIIRYFIINVNQSSILFRSICVHIVDCFNPITFIIVVVWYSHL